MSRQVTLNLDNADDVERLWREYATIRAFRDADPELRGTIEGLLPKLAPDRADEVRTALETAHPSVVLAEFFDELFAAANVNGKAVSPSMPIRTVWTIEPYAEMLAKVHGEPSGLVRFVEEMLFFFPADLPLVVRTSLQFAREATVETAVAEKIVADTIQRTRHVDR